MAIMRIATILGARPQFIKAAMISHRLQAAPGVREVLIHTGQHYDAAMSEVFFRELEVPEPDYHLGIGSGPHGAQTGRMIEAIECVLKEVKPDQVLVYGDTNSTLAGALAAVKLHIPVAHVEAGLRSFNLHMPEEVNRRLTDHVAARLFAPTEEAVANLRREGITEEKVYIVGDVMYDAALHYGSRAHEDYVAKLGLRPGEYVLATVHRAENTDVPARLRSLIEGLAQVAEEMPVVVPLHPRTRAALQREGLLPECERRLKLLGPVGYLDMMALEKHAGLVATDSGGVQKEAFFHGVPCVTLRDETEWVELVRLGWNRLLPPTDAAAIRDGIRTALVEPRRQPPAGLYGGGQAAVRIVELLRQRAA